MKFGKVENPLLVDFKLPKIDRASFNLLENINDDDSFNVYVGGAKWGKDGLKGFFPPKTKDDLSYYSNQFNSIEMNGTFYRTPTKEQVLSWKNRTPKDFKFFPKIPQSISHYGKLTNNLDKLNVFLDAIALFEEKLGMIFLQLHDHFSPDRFETLKGFLKYLPHGFPIGVELRNKDWYLDNLKYNDYCDLMEKKQYNNIVVDTPGRRDLVHLRLTSPDLFVRFVSAYHPLDYKRLDEWIEKIVELKSAGLKNLYFFIHQSLTGNEELYATYFVEEINKKLALSVRVPRTYSENLLF